MGIDLWLLQMWAQLLTNLRFAFALEDHLVPILLENFTYILNRSSCICSLWRNEKNALYILHTGPILESKDMLAIYIYIYIYIYI